MFGSRNWRATASPPRTRRSRLAPRSPARVASGESKDAATSVLVRSTGYLRESSGLPGNRLRDLVSDRGMENRIEVARPDPAPADEPATARRTLVDRANVEGPSSLDTTELL